MNTFDERPSMAERYAHAIGSHHLEVKPGRGDVDLLIAAGWAREGLGTALYRLRTEFDGVRGERQLAYRELDAAADAVRQARRAAPAGEATKRLTAALAAEREAQRYALTVRAMLLMRMKSLPSAREQLGSFSVRMATHKRFMQPDRVVLVIAGRALDLWLDPTCAACGGRGFTGGLGAAMVLCTECGGSGRRAVQLSVDEDGDQFGRALLADMDKKTDYVGNRMTWFMGDFVGREKTDPEALRAMHAKLQDLRSAQAQED